MRQAQVTRNTLETQIEVRLDLDGTGKSALATGVGFFDRVHDQTGVAMKNGIELHPVLDIVFR